MSNIFESTLKRTLCNSYYAIYTSRFVNSKSWFGRCNAPKEVLVETWGKFAFMGHKVQELHLLIFTLGPTTSLLFNLCIIVGRKALSELYVVPTLCLLERTATKGQWPLIHYFQATSCFLRQQGWESRTWHLEAMGEGYEVNYGVAPTFVTQHDSLCSLASIQGITIP